MSSKLNLSMIPAVLLLGLAAPAAATDVQGFAKGFITRPLGTAQGGAVSLLQSFYVRFEGTDHHFGRIEVVPNAPSISQIQIGFADRNADDRYFYNHQLAPYTGTIFRRSSDIEFCGGHRPSCTYPIQAPPDRANWVFVLRGFDIAYRGGDHHLDQIAVFERNGRLTVALNDQNDDDLTQFQVHYAYIPRSRFAVVSTRSGVDKEGKRVPIEAGTPVIRGFNLDFRSSDRHIRELGVRMGNARLEVYYNDNSKDDPFAWNVEYGILR